MSVDLRRCIAALLGALALSVPAAAGARAAELPAPPAATVSGSITALGGSWFSLQSAGQRIGVINALAAAATQITNADTPYVWAGGHAEAGVPSTGSARPRKTRRIAGFDCSGAVAAVLAGAGLWPAGAGVPADKGVISELLAEHLITPGLSRAPAAVTLYDDPGVHIFMNIDGRFFGTSDGGGGGERPAGPAGSPTVRRMPLIRCTARTTSCRRCWPSRPVLAATSPFRCPRADCSPPPKAVRPAPAWAS